MLAIFSLLFLVVILSPTRLMAQQAYIPLPPFGGVSVIDLNRNADIKDIPSSSLGALLFGGVAVTPQFAYVSILDVSSGAAAVGALAIDTGTNTTVAKFRYPTGSEIGSLGGIAASPDGTRVYITASLDTIAVFDTATYQPVGSIVQSGGLFGTLVVSPDNSTLYATDYWDFNNTYGNTVSVYDTASLKLITTIPVSMQPFYVAISPDGSTVAVTSTLEDTLEIISTATNTVIKKIDLSFLALPSDRTNPLFFQPIGVVFGPSAGIAYVAVQGNNPGVLVIDTTVLTDPRQSALALIPTGAGSNPYGIDISPDGSTLYATAYNPISSGVLYEMSTSSYSVTGTIPLPSSTHTVGRFVQYGAGPATGPPSLLTLAELSNNVYFGAVGYQGYTAVTLPNGSVANSCNVLGMAACSYSGFQAVAYQSSDRSQVVLAFRGTDFGDALTGLKNVLADGSFKGAVPSTDLTVSVGYAVAFLQWAQENVPGTTITLTGHSLGGAIAQLVGQASGLTTVVFNAPGGAQLISALSPTLKPVTTPFRPGTGNTNYRIFGDQVSLAGTPIGTQVTLPAPATVQFAEGSDPLHTVVQNLGAVVQAHLMVTVLGQIQANSQPIPGCTAPPCAGEPNVTAVLLDSLQPGAFGIPSPNSLMVRLVLTVASGTGYLVDPAPGTRYILTADAGTPDIASVELPPLPGVTSYTVRFSSNGTWSDPQMFPAGVEQTLPANTDGIEFDPLDADGNGVATPNSFLLYLTFGSAGTFSGTLTVAPGDSSGAQQNQ